ncbi:CYTH and CHAD domain-containing protein [Ramlibacter sp. G-1-2-2]|uniref:CYTH and CHAD domain-containing protein n=1 Tax=Ramlibacter agri TaxID=2728837 RepID=A0A848HAI4_9BURK|nr:CYTH and CHAD domain-containing protein [Ramlibacter agri]NML45473.1 CYTH and CHAD domain-containing protein [Ramlibacter agri]
MTEFELKFQVPGERVEALDTALRRGPVQVKRLRARYYDTPLEALARHGLVLRVRQEGRHWVQTAKGPGRNGFERLEHEVPLDDGDSTPDIERHAIHPVGKLLRKALGDAAQELHPVFETDVNRLTRTVEAAGTAVEIALDRGRVRAGKRSHPVQEVEFELKQGSPAAATELAQSWCEEHGLWLDPLSKSALGRRLAHGGPEGNPVQATPLEDKPESSSALVATVIDGALQQVLGNARELASGRGGDEHIHQLRVGLRRLRTALRELKDVAGLQALDPAIEPALRALFQVLGHHRDRATLLPQLEGVMEKAGAPSMKGWHPELPDVGGAIRDPAFQGAVLQLVALVQELRDAPQDTPLKAMRKSVATRLHKLRRTVERDGKKFARLPEPKRHRVRKRLKRLRYLSELVRPLYAPRDVDRFVKSLKTLQDALGEYQDAATARGLFEAHAKEEPTAWFAVGWLAAREHDIAQECEQACRDTAADMKPFWT